MALKTKEMVTAAQLKLARKAWLDSGEARFLVFRMASLNDVVVARRALSHLHARAKEILGSSALREVGLGRAREQLQQAILHLATASIVADAREVETRPLRSEVQAARLAPQRRRGGSSRTVAFVLRMFELDPELPRRPAWWLELDRQLSVSPNLGAPKQDVRAYWGRLLRRVRPMLRR